MTDRLDYLNPLGNNLTYCLALEKLCELDVPPRAQAIRVILAELVRINSHLLWLGTSGLDVGAMSAFLYCMIERELILDIFELCSGQRMMTTFIQPGGLWRDVPVEFEDTVRKFLKEMPKRIDGYEALLTKNPLFLDRTRKVGLICAEDCQRWGSPGRFCGGAGWLMICAKSSLIRATNSTILKFPCLTAVTFMPATGCGWKKCGSLCGSLSRR